MEKPTLQSVLEGRTIAKVETFSDGDVWLTLDNGDRITQSFREGGPLSEVTYESGYCVWMYYKAGVDNIDSVIVHGSW